jgi:YHS domain-containing protein
MKSLKVLGLTLLFSAVAVVAVHAEDKDKSSDKAKAYPLKTCITDGEKLGSMGKPYTFVYKGQEVKLCCQGCKADFDKDPAKYLKQIEEAKKSEKK